MSTAHWVIVGVLLADDLIILLMVVRGVLRWFYNRGGDIGPFVFVLDFVDGVTNPLLYPVRQVLPQEKRDTNLPVLVGLIVLVVIWVILLGLAQVI